MLALVRFIATIAVVLGCASLPAMAHAGVHFHTPTLYPMGFDEGDGPVGLASGDFNGDGGVDLVTVDGLMGSSSVSVLLSLGDGYFEESFVYDIGTRPLSIAVDDFDEDGLDDILVPVDGDDAVELWLSDGDGTFWATSYPVAATSPTGVAAGDFDGDGHADAAGAGLGTAIALLRGTGDGSLEDPVPYAAGGADYGKLAAGDVNGDGRDDLVASPADGYTGIAVLLGQADGTLAGPVATPTTGPAMRLIAAELNGDGHADVVIADMWGGSIDVRLGGAGAALGEPIGVPSNGIPGLGDFTGDGRLDLVVAFIDGRIAVHAGRGDGTFGPESTYDAAGYLRLPLGADLNDDGFDDVAVLEAETRSVEVAINAPAAVPAPSALTFAPLRLGAPAAQQTVRLTNDGAPPLRLGQIAITGANATDFALAAQTCSGTTLAANAACAVTVAFTPRAAGQRAATLAIPGNGAGGDTMIPLRGTTVAAPVAVRDQTPPELTFNVRRQALPRALKRGLAVRVGCSEACTLGARMVIARKVAHRLGLPGKRAVVAGRVTKRFAAGGLHSLRIRFKPRVRARLRDARAVMLTLELSATDAASNTNRSSRRVVLRG